MSTEKPPVWVSRKSCGCIVTVCASDRADAIAECHQEAQQHGLTMELIPWEEWKADKTFMQCDHGDLDRFDCEECGTGVAVDEDGCCVTCGGDAIAFLDGQEVLR